MYYLIGLVVSCNMMGSMRTQKLGGESYGFGAAIVELLTTFELVPACAAAWYMFAGQC